MPCIKMIGNMLELRDHLGALVAEKVDKMLKKMIDGGRNEPPSEMKQVFNIFCVDLESLALHIQSQNAGLIVRKASNQCSFESFEVSPTNEAVIGARGRLRRCFPGPAVVISQDRIADHSFLEPLADLIAKLDAETPEEALPTVKKAGSEVIETRDTVHPRFVTEMLTGILRAVGQPFEVTRIHKNTRDDVLWKDTLKPWRRSPLWLFLRVALQTSLIRNDDEEPNLRYKSFMVFFMTYLLEGALKASLPSDTLFFMAAKIARRALKLPAVDGKAWLQYVETRMGAVQQQLISRWNSVEKHPDPLWTQSSWSPSQLFFQLDTELKLSQLQPYLAKVSARSVSPSKRPPFTSDCGRRISRCSSGLPDLSLLMEVGEGKVRLYLADLELWVHHFLDDWLRVNMERKDASTDLTKFIDTYTLTATSVYADMPEDISIMLLTSMDLWVALDKCALHHYPLLHDYDPGFPPSLFEPLLLPKKPQMERLFRVEQYLATRRAAAIPGFPSIFRSVQTTKSFAVQYFQQSPNHQELRRKIEDEASNERLRKKSELSETSQQYHKLIEEWNSMSCQYVSCWRNRRHVFDHSRTCQKCKVRKKAGGLAIEVHEWPLPERDLEAKAAVFELNVPTVISKWRDATYRILVDILSVEPSGQMKGGLYTLHGYAGLEKFVKSQTGRLQLASTTKPFVVSHYRSKLITEADEANICVNSGLNYGLYDSRKKRWTKELLDRCDVRGKCTFKLPAGPYKGLQYAVNNTTHTSNEAIARQAECPETLTMHEFYAFGTLRSGHRLQWRNIARELTARVLNFSCFETHTLVTQAAWQVGPFSTGKVCRDSHADLEEEEFGQKLLSALNVVVGTIEGNWQGAAAARTFVALAIRLLTLSTCDMVRDGCLHFLRRVRAISLGWTRELGQKLQEGQKEEELRILNARTLEMALTCHGTFDVDPHNIPYLLKTDEDIAAMIECSIIVHDRCPATIDNLPELIKKALRQYWRLSHLLEPLLRERILKAHGGLDSTVGRLWAGYVVGSPWSAMEMPSERWVMTETSSEGDASSMLVHYNLLDGNLLVNGSPLTRLPRSYELHPTFRRLFGDVS